MANSKGLVAQGAYIEVTHQHSVSIAFDAEGKTLTRTTGSFVDDGFKVGQKVESDAAGANAGPLTVTAVTALVLTVAETLVDAAAATVNLVAFQKVGELLSFSTPAGEPGEIEMTHLESEADEFRNTLRDEGTIPLTMNFVPSDPGQIILAQMAKEPTPRTVRITLPPVSANGLSLEGYEYTFSALGRGLASEVAVKSRIVRSGNLRVTGAVDERIIPVE